MNLHSTCRCKSGLMELKVEEIFTKSSLYKFVGLPDNLQKLRKESLDPLDETNVFVAKSNVSGEGLFAKKSIGLGSVIAIYSGHFVDSSKVFTDSMSQEEKENKHKNLLSFNQTHLIDIPTPYDNLINYKATLGHKANHSFKNNARFAFVKTPRYVVYYEDAIVKNNRR